MKRNQLFKNYSTKFFFIFGTCTLLTGVCYANIYKSTDANGNVIYTDKPQNYSSQQFKQLPYVDYQLQRKEKLSHVGQQGMQTEAQGKRMSQNQHETMVASKANRDKVSEVNTSQSKKTVPVQAKQIIDYNLQLVSPKNEATIRKPAQNIKVSTHIAPPLQKGDSVVIKIDGKKMASGTSASISTDNIDRGQHTVSVEIINEKGNSVANASHVIYVHQHSKLFNKKRKKPQQKKPWYLRIF